LAANGLQDDQLGDSRIGRIYVMSETGIHEESARLTLAQRAADGAQIPPSLSSLLVDLSRRLDAVPADGSSQQNCAAVKLAQALMSCQGKVAAVEASEPSDPLDSLLDDLLGRPKSGRG
jgi:hypothetical protein